MATGGLTALSRRVLSEEETQRLRDICDKEENKFSYSVFASIIVKETLSNPESVAHFVQKTRQFEEESKSLTSAEAQALRQKVRDLEAELTQLREFKATQVASLNGTAELVLR